MPSAMPLGMPAVDSLLRLISARNADALTIKGNGIPELRKAGIPAPLSMPALSGEVVAGFLREIGGCETTNYTTASSESFCVSVEGEGASLCMTFEPSARSVFVSEPKPHFTAGAELTDTGSSSNNKLQGLLNMAIEQDASDLLLSAGKDAWLRVDGRLRCLAGTALSSEQILEELGVSEEDLADSGSMDFALVRNHRFRGNVFRQAHGIAAALRPIRTSIPTLEDLHLPRCLHELASLKNGLVLVAGTAGSGKSTTLVALIEHLNKTQRKHIITLEDPVEYEYQSKQCLIHQREVGSQVSSFADGLRAALRESPDVILVGELRDQETIAAATTAAETGHLVLGTIHASSATVAIDRMIDVFPSGQQRQVRSQLATTLRATLTQFLLDSPMAPGRVPAIELMRSTDAIAAHIRDGKTYQLPSAIQTGKNAGMIALEASLAQLVERGRVEYETALAFAKEKSFFLQLLGR